MLWGEISVPEQFLIKGWSYLLHFIGDQRGTSIRAKAIIKVEVLIFFT
jgi:hypothetical protein